MASVEKMSPENLDQCAFFADALKTLLGDRKKVRVFSERPGIEVPIELERLSLRHIALRHLGLEGSAAGEFEVVMVLRQHPRENRFIAVPLFHRIAGELVECGISVGGAEYDASLLGFCEHWFLLLQQVGFFTGKKQEVA